MKLAEKSMPDKIYTVLVQGDISKLRTFENAGGYIFNYNSGNIASISCNALALSFLLDRKIISRAELIESHIRPMNDTMVYRNRIKGVKQGAAPLAQSYDGSGILLGFIDTGIDFLHKDFKDAQGNSRIRFLWDQAAISGPSVPSPFNYGVEWTDSHINANQCTHSDMPYYGHGTHVSGIAAGNALANGTHEGCAPKADIILVALDFNHVGPATSDAVQYIFNKAVLLGKPCVINASVGDYYGSHDGTDLETKMIENMLVNTPGRVMVAAAGNAGHIKFHVKTQPAVNDTNFTWLYNGGNTMDYWFYGDSSQVANLKISVGANRADLSDLGRISFKNHTYGLNTVMHDTLKHNGNRIAIIDNASSVNNYGVYELYIHVNADSSGLVWRIETTGSGTHHAWNFDFVSSGLPTQSQYPPMAYYQMPDTMYSMVSGYQNSDEIITVGNYFNLDSYYDVNDSLRHITGPAGSLAGTSSSGPTRDGRQKPDIAATGQMVFSALVGGMQTSLIANNPQSVAQGSMHVRGVGTSASAPVVAGLAALYLQKNPNATNQEVKTAITQCAYSDIFTGSNLPNYAWGYGKLDGLAAMVCGDDLVNLSVHKVTAGAAYFPNPFKDKVSITLPSQTEASIFVYTTEGKLIFEDQFKGETYELNSPALRTTASTLFFVRINGAQSSYTFKLIRD